MTAQEYEAATHHEYALRIFGRLLHETNQYYGPLMTFATAQAAANYARKHFNDPQPEVIEL